MSKIARWRRRLRRGAARGQRTIGFGRPLRAPLFGGIARKSRGAFDTEDARNDVRPSRAS